MARATFCSEPPCWPGPESSRLIPPIRLVFLPSRSRLMNMNRSITPGGNACHRLYFDMNAEAPHSSLPYTDAKQVGATDFYFAINATFRFIEKQFGPDGLRRYWREIGSTYYAPVTAAWKSGGLPAVADYWRAFFAAEPGAEVQVEVTPDGMSLDVSRRWSHGGGQGSRQQRKCLQPCHDRRHRYGVPPAAMAEISCVNGMPIGWLFTTCPAPGARMVSVVGICPAVTLPEASCSRLNTPWVNPIG